MHWIILISEDRSRPGPLRKRCPTESKGRIGDRLMPVVTCLVLALPTVREAHPS